MNPSATGWIDKFGYLVKDNNDISVPLKNYMPY